MKKTGLLLEILLLGILSGYAGEKYVEGTPFLINYTAGEYGAHDRNEAVVCDGNGRVYFANFEGVLGYDGQEWRLWTTPGISRVTSLYIGSQDRVYAGGFNVAGRLERGKDGEPFLRVYVSDADREGKRIGEVRRILEYEGRTVFIAEQGMVWVKEDSVRVERMPEKLSGGETVAGRLRVYAEQGRVWEWHGEKRQLVRVGETGFLPETVVREIPGGGRIAGGDAGLFFQPSEALRWERVEGIPVDARVTEIMVTPDTLVIVATATYGVFFLDKRLNVYSSADEERGLCSNVVNGIAVDGKGSLWLATGKGIARIAIGSMYSRFSEREGLPGEVLTIGKEGGDLYVGTYRGLFYLSPQTGRFVKSEGISQACWQLKTDARGQLWAATGSGVFEVKKRKARRIHTYFTMGTVVDATGRNLYCGEQDAVYVYRKGQDGKYAGRKRFAMLGQVNELLEDAKGCLWMTTIFGEVYRQKVKDGAVVPLKGLENRLGNRITFFRGQVLVMAQDGCYTEAGQDSVRKTGREQGFLPWKDWIEECKEDPAGRVWITRGGGKGVQVRCEKGNAEEFCNRLKAVEGYKIRVVCAEERVAWLGGSFGLIRLDLKRRDPAFRRDPVVYFRKTVQEGASGRNIRFAFASDAPGMVNAPLYRLRLQGLDETWSDWTEKKEREYLRLPYGKYCFEVKVRDAFGKESRPERYFFRVPAPFYLKWYAWMIYAGVSLGAVGVVVKWRIRRLREANRRLEETVERRTEEIRLQRDEIGKKSQELERTLERLNRAQNELIRQEKMATVGKLTQGLVDRILNPLNYIGNFAVLARGLAAEAGKVISAEGSGMPEEVKADVQEILDMLSGNLTKIAEHGESTARVLKAMEEILKERKCIPVPVEMNGLCRRCVERVKEWFVRDLEEKNIRVVWEEGSGEAEVMADERQFEKVLMSVLGNGMYGLLKKWEKEAFEAELSVRLEVENDEVVVVIRDNGIGIEETVLGKVFDPFFTTRSTAEAAGVGLYLCREVVLNHQGEIGIRSRQGKWTEVTIKIKRRQGDGSFVPKIEK